MKFTLKINKKLLKKILAFTLPVFVVGASITTYIIKTKDNNSNLVNNNIEIENGVKRVVYLSTKDGLLTPITITIEKEELINDEIAKLVNLLKEDSKVSKDSFKGILPKDCELKNVEIIDQEVTLNFDGNFNNYDGKLEKRIVESLVWTTLQYEDLNKLKIKVNDEILTSMPLNNTYLGVSLDKSIGINNHLMVGSTYKKSINVFYEKTVDDKNYYVPVTIKVDDKENKYEEIIDGLNVKLPLYTGVKLPSLTNKIEVLKYNELDENYNLNLTLSNKILFDEKTIDNKVFDYLVMNLLVNDEDINTVSITVNDEILDVNGYNNSVIEVNKVIYNEIKI